MSKSSQSWKVDQEKLAELKGAVMALTFSIEVFQEAQVEEAAKGSLFA